MHGEGDRFGVPFRLTEPQKEFLWRLYVYEPASGRRIVKRCLLGRAKGFGKTELLAAIGLAELCGPLAPSAPNIPVAAASFEQADLLFGTAATMVREGPLASELDVFDTEILRKDGPGRMYRVAAAAGTNDGSRPTCFIADELHEWSGPKARVFLVIANSLAKRRDGLLLGISTAGADKDSLLGRMYEKGLRVRSGDEVDPGFLFDWAEADESLDPADGPEVRRLMMLQANEHVELFGLADEYERRFHEIPLHEWLRYFANRWVLLDQESWLPPGAFEACRNHVDEINKVDPVFVGVDMALKHDSIAVVWAQPQTSGRIVVREKIWLPDGDTVDVAAVEDFLRQLHRSLNVSEFAYDPAYFEGSAQRLALEKLPMVEFGQSAALMVPACQSAYAAICAGIVSHTAGPVFVDQVESAVPRTAGESWRLTKGKSKRKIDACIAMVMAVARASRVAPEAEDLSFVW